MGKLKIALVHMLVLVLTTVFLCGTSFAAGVRVVPSVPWVTPGSDFYLDVVADDIPAEGLGGVQFRLNVSSPSGTITGVPDLSQSGASDIAVASPLLISPPTPTRSGIGNFFWNGLGSNGILVMDNEALANGSALYTYAHTNGSNPPSGSGSVARFMVRVGAGVKADRVDISLSDVMLLDGGPVYPLDYATGASVPIKCVATVPSLTGLSLAQAQAALIAANLAMGSIYEINNPSGNLPLNVVLEQSAVTGSSPFCQTPIDIAINTPPVFGLNPVTSPTTTDNQTMGGTMAAGSTIVVSTNGAAVGTVTYPTSTTWSCTVGHLAPGNNTITVSATDSYGNRNSVGAVIDYLPLSATVTPSSLAADYQGNAVLSIANLASLGGDVLVEQFVDANHDGIIDAGDYAIRSFIITDGAASANPNVQGDEAGGANGTVTTSLDYYLTSDLYHAPGNYLIRVTSGSNVAAVPFTVTPVPSAQSIAGVVTDGTNPLPGAMVRLTDKWQRTIAFALADGTGKYTLNVKNPGDYLLVPGMYGYASSATSAMTVTLAAGQSIVNNNLALAAGSFHVTGQVKDDAGGAGIAGVWVEANGSAYHGLAITNADGSYDLSLPSGSYTIAVSTSSNGPAPFAKGYAAYGKRTIDLNLSADMSGQDIALPKGSVLVTGRVIDRSGQSVPGMPVQASIPGTVDSREPVAQGVTDESGYYTLGLITSDHWSIALDDAAAQTKGYLGSVLGDFSVSGPLTGNDLVAYPVTAWVQGTVMDVNGNPLPGVPVQMRNTDSSQVAKVNVGVDGTYQLGAYAGEWLVTALTADSGLLPVPERSIPLSDGMFGSLNFTVDAASPILAPATLPNGSNGVAYNQVVTATSGLAPYLFSISDGVLPDGLLLDTLSGVISGTPLSNNVTSAFSIRVTDSNGINANQAYSITIYESPTAHIGLPVAGITNNNNPMLNFSATGGTLTVKVDGAVVTCADGQKIGPLGDGPHTVELLVTNPAGITASDRVNISVDTVVPFFTLNPVITPTRYANQVLSGTREAGAVVAVSSAGPSVGTVSYPDSTSWACPLTNLLPNNNTINLTATDAAGNSSIIKVGIFYQPPMSVVLSPSAVTNDFQGNVVVNIQDLSGIGATALVEQFVDSNGNGTIDDAAYLVRSFVVTDGIPSGNINLQGDEDGIAASSIATSINYNLTGDLYHAPGRYLFRVTSGSDVALVPFTVTAKIENQSVSGTVTSGSAPVAGAIVLLADKWQRPISYTIADANGRYALNASQAGDYFITPEYYGLASAPPTLVHFGAGQTLFGQDLALSTGTYQVSGIVKDQSNGAGISGVWVKASGSVASGIAMTEADGSYSLSLPAGQYTVAVGDDPTVPNPSQYGYLSLAKQPITVNGLTDLRAVDINLPKATVWASGKLVTADGNAVVGLPVQGKNSGSNNTWNPVGFCVTGSDGRFTLGALPGQDLSISLNDLLAQNLGFIGHTLAIPSISTDLAGIQLLTQPITAWIRGTVSDSENNLIAGGQIQLRNNDSSITSTVSTSADGTYRIGTFAGNWLVDEITHNRANQTLETNINLTDDSNVSADFVLDVTPPSLRISPVITPTTSNFQTLTGTVEVGATLTAVGTGPLSLGPVSFPTQSTWSVTVNNLVEGDNSVTLTATDAAGNTTSASAHITLVIPKSFTITASAGAGGSIVPSGLTTIDSGTNASFAITAATGYVVGDVAVDGVSQGAVSSYLFSGVGESHVINSTFLPTITASAGANGSISPSGVAVVYNGTNQVYNIVPNPGYHVEDVKVDGVSAGALTLYIFTNATVTHTLSVSFAQNPIYVITASSGSNGSISPSGSVSVPGGLNQVFTFSATSGYQLSSLVVDGVSSALADTYTFNNIATTHSIAVSYLPVAGAPGSLTVPGSNSSGTVTASWISSHLSGVTYILECSKDGVVWTQVYSGVASSNSPNISSMGNGNYLFRVKATKSGYADSSYAYSGTCIVTLQCGAPPSINVPATNSSGTVTISWISSNVSGVTYILECSKDGVVWTQVYSGVASSNSPNISSMGNGNYLFRVKATKSGYADSSYAYSGTCVVTLQCGAPPSINVAATNSSGTVTVSWTSSNVSGVTYILECSKDGVVWTQFYNGASPLCQDSCRLGGAA